jgi:hypothetical protein
MAVPFLTVVRRWTHFVAIATARAVKVVMARGAIETSVS